MTSKRSAEDTTSGEHAAAGVTLSLADSRPSMGHVGTGASRASSKGGDNLTLRRYRPADEPNLAALLADPEVMRYVGEGVPLPHDETHALMERLFKRYETDPASGFWAIEENGEYAGHAELKTRPDRSEFELIYFLQRDRWGRGLGSRVVDLLLDEARRRAMPFVIATVHENNAASLAILTRRGFERDEALSAIYECTALRLDLAP